MAVKNIAAFGLYASQSAVEEAVTRFREAASATPISPYCSRKTAGRRNWRTNAIRKRRKASRPAPVRAPCWAERWAGWWASGRWQFLASARFWLPDPL